MPTSIAIYWGESLGHVLLVSKLPADLKSHTITHRKLWHWRVSQFDLESVIFCYWSDLCVFYPEKCSVPGFSSLEAVDISFCQWHPLSFLLNCLMASGYLLIPVIFVCKCRLRTIRAVCLMWGHIKCFLVIISQLWVYLKSCSLKCLICFLSVPQPCSVINTDYIDPPPRPVWSKPQGAPVSNGFPRPPAAPSAGEPSRTLCH